MNKNHEKTNSPNKDSFEKKRSWNKYVAAKEYLVLLKVIDACLERAPQLLLQIYVFRLENLQVKSLFFKIWVKTIIV